MEQMTITAKVQIVATDADKVLLDETMSVYRDACNYVSGYVFQTHDIKQFSLNKNFVFYCKRKIWSEIANGSVRFENGDCKI